MPLEARRPGKSNFPAGGPDNALFDGDLSDKESISEVKCPMSTVTVVDTHIHLWDLSKLYYDWLTDKIVIDDVLGDYSPICNRNYLPEQFVGDLPVGEAGQG